MSSQEFDLIIVGAGPGGYVAAIRAAQLGLRVACIEREAALGGTCLRIGCIPSKALLESSERLVEARRGWAEHGIRVGEVSFDLAAMMKRKDKIIQIVTKGVELLFRQNGIEHVRGTGRLLGAGRVAVDSEAGTRELSAPRIVLATGSRPASLPGIERDELIGTSSDALSWSEIPGRLAVIGGGYIGLELGSVWRRLGSQVTVYEFLDRILPGTDSEIAADALRLLKKQGFEFRLGTRVAGVRRQGTECVVECEGEEPRAFDRVLVAVGRIPHADGLGLEEIGVKRDQRGFVLVDNRFATSAEGIWAIGDLVGGPMLAHKAEEEAIACVEGMVLGHGHIHYDSIPSVVYTHPEIAAVGRTEDELVRMGVRYRSGAFPFRANARARTLDDVEGRVKVLADAETDRILGVHIIGPRAGDLIAEAATAMAFKASSEDIARASHAHPTLSEALREAALAVDGRAIHV